MLTAPIRRMAQRTSLTVLAVIIALVAMPGWAQASTYRFWNFWVVESGQWVYSPLGPASTFPADGSVQGWVFAATDADSASVAPSMDPATVFDSACSGIPGDPGLKRVAFVIDSGSPDIAPDGEVPPTVTVLCAIGALDANGYELLNSVADLRTENGFVCAMNSYPAMECSAEFDPRATQESTSVSEGVPQETPPPSSSVAPLGTAVAIGLAAVAAFYFWRRRSA